MLGIDSYILLDSVLIFLYQYVCTHAILFNENYITIAVYNITLLMISYCRMFKVFSIFKNICLQEIPPIMSNFTPFGINFQCSL